MYQDCAVPVPVVGDHLTVVFRSPNDANSALSPHPPALRSRWRAGMISLEPMLPRQQEEPADWPHPVHSARSRRPAGSPSRSRPGTVVDLMVQPSASPKGAREAVCCWQSQAIEGKAVQCPVIIHSYMHEGVKGIIIQLADPRATATCVCGTSLVGWRGRAR